MESTSVIKLTFMSDENKLISFTIPRANPSLTDEDVLTAMQEIAATNIIVTSDGKPTTAYSAELITTESTDITLA